MQKVDNVPLAKAKHYTGMWVALNDKNEVVAASEDPHELNHLVVGTKKHPPKFSSFYVPKHGYLTPYKIKPK